MSDYPKKNDPYSRDQFTCQCSKKDRFKMLLQQNALLNSYQINMEKV